MKVAVSVPSRWSLVLIRLRGTDSLMAIGIAYLLAVSGFMAWQHIILTPDYLLLLLIPVALASGRFISFLKDWVPFIALLLAWEAMRGSANHLGFRVHYGNLRPELWLFQGHLPTLVLQGALHYASWGRFLDYATAIIYILHFPMTIGIGLILWLNSRASFRLYTTALLGMACAAFVIYLVLPTAPPWYAADHGLIKGLDHIFIKTFQGDFSPYYKSIEPNPVAADPSMHAAFPFVGYLALRQALPGLARAAMVWCVVVWFTITYLGEHYLLDAATGVAFAAVAWIAVNQGLAPFVRGLQARRQGSPAPG